MDSLHEKLHNLQDYLKRQGSVAVAFSGGVDSAFLLQVAADERGEKVLAVTASAHSFPERERQEAVRFCEERGIRQVIVESEELDIEGFRSNPKNRCYLCKRELFEKILQIARDNGMAAVAEGSNLDDEGDYRPGLMAVKELGVLSPLRQVGLPKDALRQLSKELDLPTWSKPSFACLASRFAYGETISEEKLRMVDLAEQLLLDLGFTQVRVRIHGQEPGLMARIELLPWELPQAMEEEHRRRIYARLKEIGFSYVTLDLGGYRTGSMNETLKQEERINYEA